MSPLPTTLINWSSKQRLYNPYGAFFIRNKSVTDGHIDELEALRKGLKETKDKNDAQDIYIDKHGDSLKN